MRSNTWLAAVALGVGVFVRPPSAVRLRQVEPGVPVRLFLDQSRYAPGAEGHVRVETGKDGYLLVLYAEPDGHVNVAYPLDPGRSDEVYADTSIEVLTRGGTSAFTVEDSSGTGTWYAAISSRPFRLDSIAVNGHWDYRRIPRVEYGNNVESQLTSFVERLSRGRFDYDIVSFVIDTAAPRPSSSTQSGAVPPDVGGPPPPPPPAPPVVPLWWPGLIPAPWWGPPWAGPYYQRPTSGVVALAAPGTRVFSPTPEPPSPGSPPPSAAPSAVPAAPAAPTAAAPAPPATPSGDAHPSNQGGSGSSHDSGSSHGSETPHDGGSSHDGGSHHGSDGGSAHGSWR